MPAPDLGGGLACTSVLKGVDVVEGRIHSCAAGERAQEFVYKVRGSLLELPPFCNYPHTLALRGPLSWSSG